LPEYWLLVDTVGPDPADHEPGEWRLVLQVAGGEVELDITDVEPDVRGERLELLTVVRGLEALDQPSRVTIVTASRYVRSGIELGLAQWRQKGWLWESFGRLTQVKHADLWQRVDRAASIHEIRCSPMRPVAARRIDGGHGLLRRRRHERQVRSGFWGLVRTLVGA
jgi:ribonuclease HI